MHLDRGPLQGRSIRRSALRDGHDRGAARRPASAGRRDGIRAAGHPLQARRGSPPAADDPCRTRCPENARGFINTERLYSCVSTASVIDEVVPAGEPWMGVVRRGQSLRIVDLEGNQAVDTLFYNAADTAEALQRAEHHPGAAAHLSDHRHACCSRIAATPMLRIEDDTCGRHDTLGGACSAESNTVRYALEKRHMHSCRDSFLLALARRDHGGLTKRDLPSQHQFLHERAGDARRANCVSPTASPRRADTCSCGAHGHAGADLQLPAAQQPLQCVQSDADSSHDLGPRMNACSHRRDDPSRNSFNAGTTRRWNCAMFKKILIANRGAIACRILRTVKAYGNSLRRGLLRGRRELPARAAGRRGLLHRPGAGRRELPARRAHPRSRARSRAREAIHPGYGFLSRERGLRGELRSARASPSSDRRRRKCATSVSSTRRASSRSECGLPLLPGTELLADLPAALAAAETHRLSGDAQEHCRRRRHRHAPLRFRAGPQRLVRGRAAAGGRQLPQRGRVPREIRGARAAHRGADLRRWRGQRDRARRARLLRAAAQPESHRGIARARARCHARAPRCTRPRCGSARAVRLSLRGHGGVRVRRRARRSSTSSK